MLSYQPDQKVEKSDAQYLVNTVNTVGIMGKGVALDMKREFPSIMESYERACSSGRLEPGTFHLAPIRDNRTVINLATKKHWRDGSRYEWIGVGLIYLNRYLSAQERAGASVAIPMPGCGNGGLNADRVQQMMRIYLHQASDAGCDIRILGSLREKIVDPVFFAGVGSRETPEHVLEIMREVGRLMAQRGFRLRSGGAIGADSAFFDGARIIDDSAHEIFITKRRSDLPHGIVSGTGPLLERLALNFHPGAKFIKDRPGTLALHARNANQIFGLDFTNPSNVVICWTKDGHSGGGTGQAIRLAESVGIPVLDLGHPLNQNLTPDQVVDKAVAYISEFRKSRELPEFMPAPQVKAAWMGGNPEDALMGGFSFGPSTDIELVSSSLSDGDLLVGKNQDGDVVAVYRIREGERVYLGDELEPDLLVNIFPALKDEDFPSNDSGIEALSFESS